MTEQKTATKKTPIKFTKFEETRLFAARALELAKGAEPKVKLPKKKVILSRDYVEVAREEFEKGLLDLEIDRLLNS